MIRRMTSLRATPIANTGSVARDHLANERTFLAWIRTGLGCIALGVALEKFDSIGMGEEQASSPLTVHERDQIATPAILLVGAGSGCLFHGMLRYFSILHLLQKGLFRPNVAGVMLVMLTSIGFAVGGTAMVISRRHANGGDSRDGIR